MHGIRIAILLGWRNLGRNPRRSGITASGVAVAFASLIAVIGLMEGLKNQLLENGTALRLGHLQVHEASYLPDRSLYRTISVGDPAGLNRLLDSLRSQEGVQAASPRVYGNVLISSGTRSAGAQLVGVFPELEEQVTKMLDDRKEGGRLDRNASRYLVLGRALAEELQVRPGDEVALVTQAADGSMGNDLFRVAGTVESGMSQADRVLAVAHLRDVQDLLALAPGRVHEIAIRLEDAHAADAVSAGLKASGLLPAGAGPSTWGELSPQLRDYLNLTEGINAFMISLVALFAAFGLLNTMMMSVFERTREIGMLGSLGMHPVQILLAFLSEALFLTATGLTAGLGVGALIMLHFSTRGWDLSAWIGELSMLNTRMDPVLRGAWAWDHVAWAALGLASAALVAAFVPARRVAWSPPVESLAAPTEG